MGPVAARAQARRARSRSPSRQGGRQPARSGSTTSRSRRASRTIGTDVPPTVQASIGARGLRARSRSSTPTRPRAGGAAPTPREQWVLLDFRHATASTAASSSTGTPTTTRAPTTCCRPNDGAAVDDGLLDADRPRRRATYVYLPDGESRYLRLDLRRARAAHGLRHLRASPVKPVAFSASPNDFFAAIAARRAARDISQVPRRPADVLDGRRRGRRRHSEALLNEEGMLEGRRAASLLDRAVPLTPTDALITWNDVADARSSSRTATCPSRPSPGRRDGLDARRSPRSPPARPGSTVLSARYRVENDGDRGRRGAALSRAAPVPGDAAVAVAQHDRRRHHHPRDRRSTGARCGSITATAGGVADAARRSSARDDLRAKLDRRVPASASSVPRRRQVSDHDRLRVGPRCATTSALEPAHGDRGRAGRRAVPRVGTTSPA